MKAPKAVQPPGPVAMAALTASGPTPRWADCQAVDAEKGALGGAGREGDGQFPGDGGVQHLGQSEGGYSGDEQEGGDDSRAGREGHGEAAQGEGGGRPTLKTASSGRRSRQGVTGLVSGVRRSSRW